MSKKKENIIIDKIVMGDGAVLENIKYDRGAEMLYTQLAVGDFIMVRDEEDNSVIINGKSITHFVVNKDSEKIVDKFIAKYLVALDLLYSDGDGDDPDPTPGGPGGPSKGFLKLVE